MHTPRAIQRNSQKSERNELATRPKIDENKNIEKGLEILAT